MGGFRLGTVLGFEIRIHPSWFIIFFLILGTLSLGVFPASVPGLGLPIYVAMGLSGTLLFFASLLAHELAHAVVARRRGIEVEGITLFLFGGVAQTRMEFERPGDEFQVAGAGPLASVAIAVLFFAGGWAVVEAEGSAAAAAVALHLAVINLALALFNLLPGFPLDGGRLLRAGVWKATGDFQRATRYASNGGRVVAYLLMGLGVLSLFAGNPIGGVWLVLIGWFMRNAAVSSYRQVLVRTSLRGVRAADAMTPAPYAVPAWITLQSLVDEHVVRAHHPGYPVVDEAGRAVGIVTLERIKQIAREEWPRRTVAEAMVPAGDGVAVRPEEEMEAVIERLAVSESGRVIVAEEGALVGIITRSDVARLLEREELRSAR